MAISQLNPYLNFDGQAREAIDLYQHALGAKVEDVRLYSAMPGMELAPEHLERIMHAKLKLDDQVLMLSDIMPGVSCKQVCSSHLCLSFTDVEEMKRRFEALAEGGEVTLPIHLTFWGAQFGMLNDKFGVQWMFNWETASAA